MKKRNKAVIRQAAKHADAIKAGIAASFVASQIADAWFGSNHSDLTPQQARDWARVNVVLASGAIYSALEAIYSTGFQLGKATGAEAYAQAALAAGANLTPEFKAILRTNWDTWKPGNPPAAMLVNPPEGFAKVLARRDLVLRGIDQTTTDRIGTLLADGLAKGLPADQVAKSLQDLGLSSSRALTIANTEMNTAVQDAQYQTYENNGVTQVEWSVVQPCDTCASLDGLIRNLGEPFDEDGEIFAPTVHPNCMCDLIPVVDLSQYDLSEGDNIDMGDILDLAVVADLTKFNENHDEQGRFSSGDSSKNEDVKSRMTEPVKTFEGQYYLESQDVTTKNTEMYFSKYTDKNGEQYTISTSKNDLEKPIIIDEHGTPVTINTLYESTIRFHGADAGTLSANESKILWVNVQNDFQRLGLATAMLESVRAVSPTTISHSTDLNSSGSAFAGAVKAIKPELARPATAGVPGPYDVKRALNRLAILPNPPEADMADIEKYVESPWALKPTPTIDPLNWDDAKVTVINIADLYATDEYLNRKKVKRHIKAMGQALTPNRSFALVAVVDGVATIIDGHHRLLSMWLLGLDQAPVWLIKE